MTKYIDFDLINLLIPDFETKTNSTNSTEFNFVLVFLPNLSIFLPNL